jgi:type VI secretion system protein ImpB
MASNSFQNEVPKARVNIRLELHTGGAQKKVELPLSRRLQRHYSLACEIDPYRLASQGSVADSGAAVWAPSDDQRTRRCQWR